MKCMFFEGGLFPVLWGNKLVLRPIWSVLLVWGSFGGEINCFAKIRVGNADWTVLKMWFQYWTMLISNLKKTVRVPGLQSTRLTRSSHLSHNLKQGDINIVFSLTAVHRHTHICVIYPLLLHSLICTLMLLKLLASYVGLRKSTYCRLWKMHGTVEWSVTALWAIAGVCGAPVQAVPHGSCFSLIYICTIYLIVLFTQCLSFFQVCRCPGTETE